MKEKIIVSYVVKVLQQMECVSIWPVSTVTLETKQLLSFVMCNLYSSWGAVAYCLSFADNQAILCMKIIWDFTFYVVGLCLLHKIC